jgi:hypothetical protein
VSEFKNDIQLIKEQRKLFLDTIEALYNNNPKKIINDSKKHNVISKLILADRIKRSYYIKERNIDVYDLLSMLNITIIKDTINNNRMHPDGSVLELVVDTKSLDNTARRMGDCSYVNGWNSKVINIKVYDKIYDF